ncbi:MAG: substrate-specific activator of APC-dependent proteolysis [Chrysothrix sp. TS-e1954]|nr:MAG: substrate-specific activator of APC-dependent proteolysis [Chrysothrix sp. TS-e1954]
MAQLDNPFSDPPATSSKKSQPTDNAPAKGPAARTIESASEPVNSSALSKALTQVNNGDKVRERTPESSPSRKRQRVHGDRDRFIPNRQGRDLQAGYSLLHDDGSPATPSRSQRRPPHDELHFQKTEEANRTFSSLLRSEMFDDSIPTALPSGISSEPHQHSKTPPGSSSLPVSSLTPSTPHKNLFTYSSPRHHSTTAGQLSPSRTPASRRHTNMNPKSQIYSLSPVKFSSQQMLLSPRKQPRSVSRVPYKVLDAPDLANDFYLNLVDWGSTNILGVGLGHSVYMWNSTSGKVVKLCEFGEDEGPVTSVNWIERGSHIAIGTHKGYVQIWDAERQRKLRTMVGHTGRVGALTWNEHILSSGSRDRTILHRDVRSPDAFFRKLTGHKQEICGLKWNTEDQQLASGGNDNKLMVWDDRGTDPIYKFSQHTAAVKAIAWSPHQRGLLASGGGTADRKIKFWNTMNGSLVQDIDTGSQVCNLAWSKNSNEIVSTHGYSQNQIVVWKYPSMTQVVSLTGHTYRVLYLAMSPDGQVIVTGAGDETLRFWNCFKRKETLARGIGKLDEWATIR